MKDAFVGGKAGNGEPFYVCSGNLNGQQIPGKLYRPTGCCYVPHFSKEYCTTEYSFLEVKAAPVTTTPPTVTPAVETTTKAEYEEYEDC